MELWSLSLNDPFSLQNSNAWVWLSHCCSFWLWSSNVMCCKSRWLTYMFTVPVPKKKRKKEDKKRESLNVVHVCASCIKIKIESLIHNWEKKGGRLYLNVIQKSTFCIRWKYLLYDTGVVSDFYACLFKLHSYSLAFNFSIYKLHTYITFVSFQCYRFSFFLFFLRVCYFS